MTKSKCFFECPHDRIRTITFLYRNNKRQKTIGVCFSCYWKKTREREELKEVRYSSNNKIKIKYSKPRTVKEVLIGNRWFRIKKNEILRIAEKTE